jgi:PKD repeat protein
MRSVATLGAIGLAVLVFACGGSSSPTAPSSPPPAVAPTASFTVSPGGQAIIGVTVMTFTAAPSSTGESLTYSWNFGDGTQGTGATAKHVFNTENSWQVILTVSNGTATATAQNTVVARSLSGFWFDPINPKAYTFTFAQNGQHLTASPDGVTGSLSNPRNIFFETFAKDYVFTGTVEKGLDGMEVSYPSPDGLVTLRLCRETC